MAVRHIHDGLPNRGAEREERLFHCRKAFGVPPLRIASNELVKMSMSLTYSSSMSRSAP